MKLGSDSMHAVEYADAGLFQQKAGDFLVLREAENCYFLSLLLDISANAGGLEAFRPRLFAVEESGAVVAAAMLFPSGRLLMTGAADETARAFIDFLAASKVQLTGIHGPAPVSRECARAWLKRTGQGYEVARTERVYQLDCVTYPPPASGRMEVATVADRGLLTGWFKGFGRETACEDHAFDKMLDYAIECGTLFLWKDPVPVAMATWCSPTLHGGCINLVYTPPELRRRGYAKAVVSGLGRRMLASGRRYCFILTEPTDSHTNSLYQQIGARAVCELMRCNILAAAEAGR